MFYDLAPQNSHLFGNTFQKFKQLRCQSPPNDKPKWELKMLSDRLIELNVVEHISVTMVRRVLKKMS